MRLRRWFVMAATVVSVVSQDGTEVCGGCY